MCITIFLPSVLWIGISNVVIFLSLFQSVHPTIRRTHIEKRLEKLVKGEGLDWATAEALAIGSLLCQGTFYMRMLV